MARKGEAWMAFYIADYLADTMHLGREHHGSYLLLIFAAYRNEGWLPNDDSVLAQIAKCTAKQWKSERTMFAAFFRVSEDRWTHKRVSVEYDKAQKNVRQRSEAGTASAAKRERERNGRSTDVATEPQRNARPSPSPSPGEPLQGSPPMTVETPSPTAARGALEAPTHDIGPMLASLSTSLTAPADELEIPTFLRRTAP